MAVLGNRDKAADLYKGAGIVLVAMGHMGFYHLFDWYIHAFHMMMFFLAAGYFFVSGKYSFRAFIRRNLRSLILPYLVFGLVNYLFWLAFFREGENALVPLGHLFFVNTTHLPIAGALWFLTAVFISEALYWWTDRLFPQRYARIAAAAVTAAAGHLACLYLPWRLPYALDAALVGTAMVEIGRELADYEKKHRITWDFGKPARNLTAASLFILFSACCFLNINVNMRTGEYGKIPFFWFNAVSMCLVLWVICRMACNEKANEAAGQGDRLIVHVRDRISDYLEEVGRNSIVYLCLSQLIAAAVMKAAGRIPGHAAVGKLAGFIVSMGICRLLARLFMGSRLKVLFGK